MLDELRERAHARIMLALLALTRSELGGSTAVSPAAWTDGPPPARPHRASPHVACERGASCTEVIAPRVVDETQRTGRFRIARGTPVELPALVSVVVTPRSRYRSLAAMRAGFAIERLIAR